MHPHVQLIEKFYTSFQQLDWRGMIECYHEDVFFYDPVFENLHAAQARAMWEMLCNQAVNFSLEFYNVKADEEYGSCNWKAGYLFSSTARPVTNLVQSHFQFFEGKIVEHMDHFSFWNWSRQALGAKGLLLGWSSLVQNKVRQNARRRLEKFMISKQTQGPKP
jgi:hypothetical protein